MLLRNKCLNIIIDKDTNYLNNMLCDYNRFSCNNYKIVLGVIQAVSKLRGSFLK